MPPLIKTFTWRLIRRALSSADRAARFSNHIDEHCATCGAIEDDAHLFFHCQLSTVVHNAVAAHLNTHTQAVLPFAETTDPGPGVQAMITTDRVQERTSTHSLTLPLQPDLPRSVQPAPIGMTISLMQDTMVNRYTIATPDLLQRTRCYIDASTSPDQPNGQTRMVGLGVFIFNSQVQPSQSIYIRAKLLVCTSVLMAEAASLALATMIIHRLNIRECIFLSDCQQLVQFISLVDHSNPPEWRIKPFTQIYQNFSNATSARVLKINKNNNTTANALTRQALDSQGSTLATMCSHQHGYDHCSVSQVLQTVDLQDVIILAARCC